MLQTLILFLFAIAAAWARIEPEHPATDASGTDPGSNMGATVSDPSLTAAPNAQRLGPRAAEPGRSTSDVLDKEATSRAPASRGTTTIVRERDDFDIEEKFRIDSSSEQRVEAELPLQKGAVERGEKEKK